MHGPQAPRFIVIEGPLRVGKTTLAKILAERLHARRIYDCEDNPFLAAFYQEKTGAAFHAQMYFLVELKLYERYYEALTAELPQPDLVIYLQAKPEVLRARIAKKKAPEESRIAPVYVEEVAKAYEHFFFHYAGADLLVVDTSEIDFVERSEDLQQLLKRLAEPVKGTQYYLPLGGSD